MGWLWKKTNKNNSKLKKDGNKQQKKRRSQTFILEEIISPSVAFCPVPIDDSLDYIKGLELFTQEELVAAILGNNSAVDINNIDTENLFENYFAKIDEYFAQNPTETDAFDVENSLDRNY
ncbi:MAG: hypothetical protein SWX82_19925 [Cyanobacteriota bacterium]|nr:hypothetical protein [Cyanobacteriota bacterium]